MSHDCVATSILSTFSLVKMLYWVVRKNCPATDDEASHFFLTASQLTQAVRRNFGGSDEFDPLDEFQDCLQSDILEEVHIHGSHVIISVIVYCISNLKYCPCLCMQNIQLHSPKHSTTISYSHVFHMPPAIASLCCGYTTGSQIHERKINWPPDRHGQ